MFLKIVYWSSTAIVGVALLGALSYLTGSEQVVSGFARSGYPQHLRIVLGFAKPAAAIVLLAPGLPLLKEWAYAGATFALVMATIAAYSIGDGVKAWGMPHGHCDEPARMALTKRRVKGCRSQACLEGWRWQS